MTSEPETGMELPPYLVPHSRESIRILYADDSLLIIDKPHLLLSVPGRHPLNRDSLITRLERLFPGVAAAHRLDLDTSGILVVPRNKATLVAINKQFQNRTVLKTYRALVYGEVKDDQGQIDLPLIRDWHNRPRQKICTETGKPSVTHYRVLDRQPSATLLELKPITGRSHQLRIHLMALGHPILGCDLYAHQKALAAAPRLLLHACQLTFKHPLTKGNLRAYSPPPFDITGLFTLRPG
jgi:tRNA pseudouridine32 synthase/23S rRNA pseudouridine746 synthase